MKFLKTSARILCFLTLGVLPSAIFAADQCTIEKGPDTALSQYLTNLDTALEKLKDSTKNASCGALGGKNVPSSSENIERAAALIVRGTNRALNQDCYLGAAAFNTELALKSETPIALRRDLKLLVSKQEDLTLTVDQLYQTCGQNTSLETQTILPGESGNMSAGEIAETLIKNHTSIVCLYRNVTTGRPPLETQFLLTPTDFTSKIQTAYGPGAIQSCTVRGDVFKRLSTAITKVGETARNLKGKMSEWQNSNQALESEDEKRARATKESELAPKLKKA
jgi:hypothetical protein